MVHDKVNRHRVLTTYPARLTKLDCHNDVVHAFHRVCFNFNEVSGELGGVIYLTR